MEQITLQNLLNVIDYYKKLTKNNKLLKELDKLFDSIYYENEFVQHEGFPDVAPFSFIKKVMTLENEVIQEYKLGKTK